MRFYPGHKLSPGGKKGGKGGRPSLIEKEIDRRAEAIARDFIEKNIKPVLDTYGKVAKGYNVKKTLTTKAGNTIEFTDFVYDSRVLTHYMDRIVPPRAAEDRQGRAVGHTLIQINLDVDD